jgi:hypothetical protein
MLTHMRTTLHLDPDVAALLGRVRRMRKEKLRTIVNEALRRGLAQLAAKPAAKRPYRTPGFDGGRCLVSNLDDVSEVLIRSEGESFK